MKAGDLVRAGDSIGTVLNLKYVKNGEYWVTCLWNDGVVEGCADGDLELLPAGTTPNSKEVSDG